MNLRTDKTSVDTKKSWNDVIGQFDIQPHNTSTSTTNKITKAKTTQKVAHKKQQRFKTSIAPSRWLMRGVIVIACFSILGNIPFQSSITLKDTVEPSNFAISIDATSSEQQISSSNIDQTFSPRFQLDPEFQRLSLPSHAIETYIGNQAIDINSKWASYTVKSYDNPSNILHKVGLDHSIGTLLRDKKIKTVLSTLKRDNIVRARSVNGKLVELLLAPSYKKAYAIKPSTDGFEGIWEGKWIDNIFEIRQARSSFVIKNGLFLDGKKAGVPGNTIRQIIKV